MIGDMLFVTIPLAVTAQETQALPDTSERCHHSENPHSSIPSAVADLPWNPDDDPTGADPPDRSMAHDTLPAARPLHQGEFGLTNNPNLFK
jgi:hypothetical protein